MSFSGANRHCVSIAADSRPAIVHLSADYPDAVQPRKTSAISRLIDGTADRFEHRVYSLNRKSGGMSALLKAGRVTTVNDDETLASWKYAALPGGIRLAAAMNRVADTVIEDLMARNRPPDLIHAHKLSFEGLAALRIAAHFRVPYVITLQGNTDRKLLRLRPDLRRKYRAVWQGAAKIIAFAPWIAEFCEDRLGQKVEIDFLPCITQANLIVAPSPPTPGPIRIVSAFNLNDWRNKNLAALIDAMAELRKRYPDATLEIAGGGDDTSMKAVKTYISENYAGEFGRLLGPLSPADLPKWLNEAQLFAMPSHAESFGMVFVEALLSGCPIIYSENRAVAGWFEDEAFARPVNPKDAAGISAEMAGLIANDDEVRSALRDWQTNRGKGFLAPAILNRYSSSLLSVLKNGAAGED